MSVESEYAIDERIHVAGLAYISNRELVLRRSDSERANHHGGEGVGEFALEHRAFAGDHTMIGADFAEEERRKHIGKMDLARALKITAGEIEILGHDAEIHVFRAKNMPNLAERFLDAQVGPCIAVTVVAREDEPQLLVRGPALADAEHPAQPG